MEAVVAPNECNIRVVCRVRPLNQTEIERKDENIVKPVGNDQLSISGTQGSKTYTFDNVLKPNVTQEYVYDLAAKAIVTDVLNGYNGTIFAYGQTSSGKTHTMEGVLNDPKMQGIIPRIVQDIFNHIYSMDENLEFHIKVSYFEIYMERITDLLDPNKNNLAIHEDKNRVPYVKGVTERFVTCLDEVMEVIDEGKSNRHIAVTNMNEHSSRSHSIFLIHVKQENELTQKKLSGKLYLVDLAGSEKVSKTGATGETLDEAKNINKSLACLGNVISALAEGTKSHIPYRDSKLTRILQESLGGNSRTTMVICCSPASYNEPETRSTLLFGQRAKTIKNVVVVNEELTAEEWKRRYEKEKEKNAKLRTLLEKTTRELDKWRQGERVSSDDQFSLLDRESFDTISPSPSNNNVSSIGSSAHQAGEGKTLLDDERKMLYSQLDEKDEEIATQGQLVERLKTQMLEQEHLVAGSRADYEKLQTEMGRLQVENQSTKEEVKEVLQALEELALNYDQKSQEADEKAKEFDKISVSLNEKQKALQKYETDILSLKDQSSSQRKRLSEMMSSLMHDLGDISHAFGSNFAEVQRQISSGGKLEEDFTAARIYANKLKSEVKSLTQRVAVLEAAQIENATKMTESQTDLSKLRLLVTQYEAQIKSLDESIQDAEKRRRDLENEIDNKNEKIAQLKASENMHLMAVEEKEEQHKGLKQSAEEMKQALEKEMEHHREAHQKQLCDLRDDLDSKSHQIETLKSENQRQTLALSQMESELQDVKKEEKTKSERLSEMMFEQSRRDQAHRDLKSLEETVSKELHSLHNVRKLFVEELQARFKKSHGLVQYDSDGIPIGSCAQRQISFLETNLDTLTKVHRQLVKDNADLRTELPKLERRLKMTAERVKSLETALTDAKQSAFKERAKYQSEVEKIKEAVRQRDLIKRKNQGSAHIAKAIRPGQQPVPKASNTTNPQTPSSKMPTLPGMLPKTELTPEQLEMMRNRTRGRGSGPVTPNNATPKRGPIVSGSDSSRR